MILSDLATVARRSGLTVVEVAGWKTRGHGQFKSIEAVIDHHTATPKTAKGDYPSLAVVRDGRTDLVGPLCNLGLGRSGTVYVVAAGVAYHAGTVFDTWQDNWHAIGIEAEADGVSAWPAVQVAAYARLNAALCKGYGVPVARVLGHKEIARPKGRKTDPNLDMNQLRAATTRALNTGDDDVTTPEQMTTLVNAANAATAAATKAVLAANAAAAAAKEAGQLAANSSETAGRRWALYTLRYGLQTEDERIAAREEYEARRKAGDSVEQAMAAAAAILHPLDDSLEAAQGKG